MQCVTHYQSPIGPILLAADDSGLTGLWFEGQECYAFPLGIEREEREIQVLVETRHWLDLYFSGKQPDFDVPLHLTGTAFQNEIWKMIRAIAYGTTTTYGEIAREYAAKMGFPRMSAQAVGGAVGRNPISILVPCHRVVGADGSLTGYAGGLERKRFLLELEADSLHSLPEKSLIGY